MEVDYVLPAEEMGEILGRLTAEQAPATLAIPEDEKRLLKKEIAIAAEGNAFALGIMDEGELAPLTCPECHGALVKFTTGKVIKYRCHTGHSFTGNALLAGITEVVESTLIQSMRAMEEATMLMENIASHFEESGAGDAAQVFWQKAKQSEYKARLTHDIILQEERLSKDLALNKELKKVV